MKIVLATGIYPPDIGGPAIYCRTLAEELTKRGAEITVLTYVRKSKIPSFDTPRTFLRHKRCGTPQNDKWEVIYVSKRIPILRWVLYALALRKYAKDADVVYAFSSVSVGVPLVLARLKKPKRVLRLGGDFFWERYTAMGGMMSLREWYESLHWSLCMSHRFMHRLLNRFDHIVFSTRLQEELYENFYQSIPGHSVIENAIPELLRRSLRTKPGSPFRLLFMGRFVGFKNLPMLLEAVSQLPHVRLTCVGSGHALSRLKSRISEPGFTDRLDTCAPVHNIQEKQRLFSEHDLLVIPSITEISPNVALEARAAGLPVLLTEETGLSEELRSGMVVRSLRTPGEIVQAVLEVGQNYATVAREAAASPPKRTWSDVCEEHLELLKRL